MEEIHSNTMMLSGLVLFISVALTVIGQPKVTHPNPATEVFLRLTLMKGFYTAYYLRVHLKEDDPRYIEWELVKKLNPVVWVSFVVLTASVILQITYFNPL